jgi:hypothetical protein
LFAIVSFPYDSLEGQKYHTLPREIIVTPFVILNGLHHGAVSAVRDGVAEARFLA